MVRGRLGAGNIVTYYPEGLTWQDGSLELDLPMVKLAEMFNVNHFIVSQVNPHVIPFSTIGTVYCGVCACVCRVSWW